MSSKPLVGLLLLREADLDIARSQLRDRARVVTMASLDDLNTLVAEDPQGVMCSTEYQLSGRPLLVRQLRERGVRVLLRARLHPTSIAEVGRIARLHPAVAVSVATRGTPDAGLGAHMLFDRDHPGPVGAVIGATSEAGMVRWLPYLMAAMILGRDRTTVADFARVLDVAPRTVQDSLRRLDLHRPSELLRWARVVWLAWRLEHLGMSAKEATAAGGFSDISATRTMVRATTGETLRGLARPGALDSLVKRFRDALSQRAVSTETSDPHPKEVHR